MYIYDVPIMNINASEFKCSVGETSDADVVASLKMAFPTWNSKSLRSTYESCGRDWSRTLQEIYQIESEIHGGCSSSVSRPVAPAARPPNQFPALGNPVPRNAGTSTSCSSWAAKARHSNANPTSVTANTSLPPRSYDQTSKGAPRAVWESQGKIQQYETGHALSQTYALERENARDLALARNKLFEEATRAFQRGDKKLAKELGAKGREYNERMHQAHDAAAHSIFASRNSVSSQSCGRRTVDLHGLHVREASRVLAGILDECKRQSMSEIDVVVGTGNHSTTQSGVLRRSMIDQIVKSGYRYREEFSGCITVYL